MQEKDCMLMHTPDSSPDCQFDAQFTSVVPGAIQPSKGLPGLLLGPFAIPGRRRSEGLQCCGQNAHKQHGNVCWAGLTLHIPLVPLALPAVLQCQ